MSRDFPLSAAIYCVPWRRMGGTEQKVVVMTHKKLRLLCLHGMGQNSVLFSKKSAALFRGTEDWIEKGTLDRKENGESPLLTFMHSLC